MTFNRKAIIAVVFPLGVLACSVIGPSDRAIERGDATPAAGGSDGAAGSGAEGGVAPAGGAPSFEPDAGSGGAGDIRGPSRTESVACVYECNDPQCAAACGPKCEKPSCVVACQPPRPAPNCLCETKCDAPSCHTRCPTNQCETDSCPSCETVCDKPSCQVTCSQIDPNGATCEAPPADCQPLCEPTSCAWSCEKPSSCAAPSCNLVCEGMPPPPPAAAPPDASGTCHPECRWLCDDPLCNAEIAVECPATACGTPSCTQEDCTCDVWPTPAIESCADAHSKEPTCTLALTGQNCHSPSGAACSCKADCPTVTCTRSAPLDERCTRPRCELQCERPACEAP